MRRRPQHLIIHFLLLILVSQHGLCVCLPPANIESLVSDSSFSHSPQHSLERSENVDISYPQCHGVVTQTKSPHFKTDFRQALKFPTPGQDIQRRHDVATNEGRGHHEDLSVVTAITSHADCSDGCEHAKSPLTLIQVKGDMPLGEYLIGLLPQDSYVTSHHSNVVVVYGQLTFTSSFQTPVQRKTKLLI